MFPCCHDSDVSSLLRIKCGSVLRSLVAAQAAVATAQQMFEHDTFEATSFVFFLPVAQTLDMIMIITVYSFQLNVVKCICLICGFPKGISIRAEPYPTP